MSDVRTTISTVPSKQPGGQELMRQATGSESQSDRV